MKKDVKQFVVVAMIYIGLVIIVAALFVVYWIKSDTEPMLQIPVTIDGVIFCIIVFGYAVVRRLNKRR